MNILEFTRSTHVRNKIVVGNYHVVQLVVNFGISTMLYVPVVARVDNLSVRDPLHGRGSSCSAAAAWRRHEVRRSARMATEGAKKRNIVDLLTYLR